MFAEVRKMLPISGDDYDEEIIMQIKAAALDLTTSTEIVLPGIINISRTWTEPEGNEPGYWTINDRSSIRDELVMTAIAIWCNMRIGNPPNMDNLQKSYNALKGQMRMSRRYTRYGGGGDGCE